LWDAERLLNEPGQFENRDGRRGAHVNQLAAGLRRMQCAHERLDGVVDIRERPHLLAVAVDVDRLPAATALRRT